MIRVGIDIGGTFTDFAVWQGGRQGYTAIRSFKLPSTPPSFADAVKHGLGELAQEGIFRQGEDVLIVHGTTVSTNTVIERSGPPLAMLTTAGFRDILRLQRLRLDNALDLFSERPLSLIPRDMVFPIDERLDAHGDVLVPLDCAQVVAAARRAQSLGVSAIVICFLHSYRSDRHEIEAREAIRTAGIDCDVILSSEIFPQQGEYERAIAAVLNAYVKPVISAYIRELQEWLRDALPSARLLITRSNGGVMSAPESCQSPIHTLLSGPSAGVTAARYLGSLIEAPALLTMDMGGTSTDLSLIWQGRASVTTQALVGDFPLMMPVTGIEAIGAGGGSIAAIDGSVLTVGPRSAGARPGPACYGRGGTKPTLSDAYLLCGLLDPKTFLGGRMELRRDLAEAAMQPVAAAIGRDLAGAAEACIAVGTSNMVAAVLPYLARVGVDPEDLTLLLYGGAGAVHGPLLAEEIGIRRLIVPRTPSVFCALGGLVSDLVHDVVAAVRGIEMTLEELQRRLTRMRDEAQCWLDSQITAELLTASTTEYFAEMRYRGQFFTIETPLPELTALTLAAAAQAFECEHERVYNHRGDAPVEFVALRARVTGHLLAPEATPLAQATIGLEGARMGSRAVTIAGRTHPAVPVYDRALLGPGHHFDGIAIVEQADATVFVPQGFSAEVGVYGDLILTKVA
jgi:N-methylhydantoinase A